jgi:hypothetical protein
VADVPDPGNLKLRTWINGELRQEGSTRDMIFDIPYLIEYLSSFMTLQPGDMIATGTPEGLADVVPGDEVIVEVEGVGRLVIGLSAKRNSSPRRKRLEHHDQTLDQRPRGRKQRCVRQLQPGHR